MNRRVDAVLRCPCRLLLAVGITLVALFAVPSLAGASTDYWVEACGPSAVDDFSFFSSDSANLVGSDSACGASNPTGLAVNDLATGAQEQAGTTAFWALSAPTDETIQGLFYTGGNFTTSGGGWIAGWQGDNGEGLTPTLDPDAGHDCSSPNTVCNVSNSEAPDFAPGVGVGPLNQVALAIDCENSSCISGGNSARVTTATIELFDPNDMPDVDAAVANANVLDGYDTAASHLSLSYSAYDPAGVCVLDAELVSSKGNVISASTQGTSSPALDPGSGFFTETLPCGPSNTSATNATTHGFAPSLASLPTGTYDLKVVADNPGQVFNSVTPTVVWQSSPIKVDNSTPTVSISTNAQPNTWYGSPQQVTITASDDPGSSGVDDVICTGPGTPGADQPIAAAQLPYTITVQGPGPQTVGCHAISNSGISSSATSTTLDIDNQAPATALGGAQPAPAVLASPQAVTVAASEPQVASGIKSTICTVTNASRAPQSYTISGTSGQLAGADFSDGKNVVSCQSTTNAGIVGQLAAETIEIDDQQPVVHLGGATPAPAWSTDRQQVTATASEPNPSFGFGVASVSCQVNGGASKSASGDHESLSLSGTGTYDIACAATSAAGVRGPDASERIQIDDALPTGGHPVISGGSAGVPGGWSRTSQRVTLVFTAHGGATMSEVRCRVDGRETVLKPGDAGVTTGAGRTKETVAVTVPPPGGTLVCQGLNSAGAWSKPVSRSLQIDAQPPTGDFGPADRRDPTQVRAHVEDSGSGLASAVVEIEERSGWKKLATRYDKSMRLATATVPDDGSIPNGTYTLRVDARDVAGNAAMLDESRHRKLETVTLPLRELTRLSAVVSAGSDHVVAIANAAGAPTRRHEATQLTLSYGQRSRLSGELTTVRGAPINGASILVEQGVSGASPTLLARLRTDVAGRFDWVVPPGPTRTLELVYEGTKVLRTTSATANVRVGGRATIAVGSRPVAGRQLTIDGRVLGGWIPSGGVLVQLWYEVKGDKRGWAPFEHAIHTSRSGSWRLTFPVSPRAAGYTYEFKAVVSNQASWPFLGTTSAILTRAVARL